MKGGSADGSIQEILGRTWGLQLHILLDFAAPLQEWLD